MARPRHLREGLDHRVVGRLEEHDVRRVALDDLVDALAVDLPELLQRLQDDRELLVLPEPDREHGLEAGDAVAFGLQVAELVEHEARLVQRLLVRLRHVRLVEVQVHELLDQDQDQLRVLHQVRRRDEEDRLGRLAVPDLRRGDGRDLRDLGFGHAEVEVRQLLLGYVVCPGSNTPVDSFRRSSMSRPFRTIFFLWIGSVM